MYDHILVPIADDHDPNSGRAVALAGQLLNEGGSITALTVVEAVPDFISAELPSGALEGRVDETQAALEADIGGARDVKSVVVTGHSARTILEYAEEQGVDCIIMSSHRPGLADYFLGSTSARVVRHANCAVHVVR